MLKKPEGREHCLSGKNISEYQSSRAGNYFSELLCVHVCVCACVDMYARMCACMCVCTDICVRLCVRVFLDKYLPI